MVRKSVPSPSVALPLVPLRILAPEEADERVRNREAWADVWQAVAREADADRKDEPRADEEAPAETAA